MKKLILISLIGLFSITIANAQYPTNVEKDVREKVQLLIQKDFTEKIQPQLHKVYVRENVWRLINIETKKKITLVLAMYVNMHTDQDVEIVKIYSWTSGQKLARYNSFSQFKFFD
jgi:hypothetical protein